MTDHHWVATAAPGLAAPLRGARRAAPGLASLPLSVLASVLRVADVAVIYLCGIAIHQVRGPADVGPDWITYQLVVAVAALAAANLFQAAGCYDARRLATGRLGLPRLLGGWIAVWIGLLVTAVMLKVAQDFSRIWFAGWGIAAAGGLLIARMAAWVAVQRWVASGRLAIGVALIGGGRPAGTLAAAIAAVDGGLYRVLGIFDDRSGPGTPGLGELESLIRSGQVETVVIAVPWSDRSRIRALLARLAGFPVDVRLAPVDLDLPLTRLRVSRLSDIPVFELACAPLSGWRSVVKRAEDLVIGSALLLLFAPLMLIIAAAVRWESPGPVLFRQKRYGYNNQLIEVLKFRSMRQECADPNAERLVGPNDSRVTPLGSWLRRTSLDELPQLLNVVRGDMSLVGPRPHALRAKAAERLYEDVVQGYAARHRVKPGITGWAQVNGWRGVTDTEQKIQRRVEHDLHYIEHWSLLFDLRILVMTVAAVVRPTNAH